MRSLALVLLVIVAIVVAPALGTAEEIRKPSKERGLFRKSSRNMSDEEKKAYAIDYIAKWKASGQKTSAVSRYALAQFQQIAEQYKDAMDGFRATRTSTDAKMKDKTRDYGATGQAGLLLLPAVQEMLGQAGVDKVATELEAYAEKMLSDPSRLKSRHSVLTVLARLHTQAGRYDNSHKMRMQIIKEDPKKVSSQLMPVMRNLLASAYKMDSYDGMRTKAKAALDKARELGVEEVVRVLVEPRMFPDA